MKPGCGFSETTPGAPGCFFLFALRSLLCALCSPLYALCSVLSALRSWLPAAVVPPGYSLPSPNVAPDSGSAPRFMLRSGHCPMDSQLYPRVSFGAPSGLKFANSVYGNRPPLTEHGWDSPETTLGAPRLLSRYRDSVRVLMFFFSFVSCFLLFALRSMLSYFWLALLFLAVL